MKQSWKWEHGRRTSRGEHGSAVVVGEAGGKEGPGNPIRMDVKDKGTVETNTQNVYRPHKHGTYHHHAGSMCQSRTTLRTNVLLVQ